MTDDLSIFRIISMIKPQDYNLARRHVKVILNYLFILQMLMFRNIKYLEAVKSLGLSLKNISSFIQLWQAKDK